LRALFKNNNFINQFYQQISQTRKRRNKTMSVMERCQRMLDELGIPVTKFCRNINLSTFAFYEWKKGNMKLSDERMKAIDAYLTKYNF